MDPEPIITRQGFDLIAFAYRAEVYKHKLGLVDLWELRARMEFEEMEGEGTC